MLIKRCLITSSINHFHHSKPKVTVRKGLFHKLETFQLISEESNQ